MTLTTPVGAALHNPIRRSRDPKAGANLCGGICSANRCVTAAKKQVRLSQMLRLGQACHRSIFPRSNVAAKSPPVR